jgi:hypothetical protein
LLALVCGNSYGSCFEMAGLMGTTFDMKSLPEILVIKRITDVAKMAPILLKYYENYKEIQSNILKNSYKK